MSTLEFNVAAAEKYLIRFKQFATGHFINGAFMVPEGNSLIDNISPIDQSVLGQIAIGTDIEIDHACDAAQAAFPAWRDIPGSERRALLHHFADKIVERADEIALIESMDTGQPIKFMKKTAIRGAANFRFFADKAPEATAGISSFQEEHTNFTSRVPIGPIGVITPWNTPLYALDLENRASTGSGVHDRT